MRFGYFFSYWIVSWFVIYYLVVKTNFIINKKPVIPSEYKQYITENLNPKLALFIALFENIIIFLWLFANNVNMSVLIKYLIMIMIFKVIPLFLLKDDIIKMPYDLIPVSSLFVIYMIYLTLYNQTVYKIYKTSNAYLVKGENKTPFFETIQWIYDRYL